MNDFSFPQTPREVHIAITGRCNLRCKHCSYADPMTGSSDLPTDAWMDFLAELEDCGIMKVTVTGGEPFTRQDLFTLIDGIVRHKMRFLLLTNGILMTEAHAQRLVDTGRLDGIQVSIDGASAEVHERLRSCTGSFEGALRGLRILTSVGAPVAVRFTVSPLNLDELADACRMLLDLGVNVISVNEVYALGAGLRNYDDLKLTPAQYGRAMGILTDFNREHPGVLKGQAGPFIAARWLKAAEHTVRTGEPIRGRRAGYLSACGCVFNAISVLHDGQYVPCHQLSDLHLGRIRVDRLRDLWQNSPTLQNMRNRYQVPLEQVEGCRGCKYQIVCTGGCPAPVYATTGRLDLADHNDCYRTFLREGITHVS